MISETPRSGIFPDAPADKRLLEEGDVLTPRFGADGLVTAVVTDAEDGELLMVAHMNADALSLSIESGIAHYWSRSRRSIWKKGETSGNLQTIVEMRVDCDQDAVQLKVRVAGEGATCHTGRRSCFYRKVGNTTDGPRLAEDVTKRHVDGDGVRGPKA